MKPRIFIGSSKEGLYIAEQIKEIKKANSNITPIIFMDEPSVSQLGSSAFLTIEDNEVLEMFNVVSSLIKKFGGIVGMHCCGKSNWEIPINASVDMINFDSYLYPQSVAIHHKKIQDFINNGGILAFGIIPTVDDELIQKISEEELIEKFTNDIDSYSVDDFKKEVYAASVENDSTIFNKKEEPDLFFKSGSEVKPQSGVEALLEKFKNKNGGNR